MKTRKQVQRYQKKLKNNPTKAESIAFEILKKEGLLLGVDFLFQEIFGFYILDFVFPSKRLIIELDGSSHRKTKKQDEIRDLFCQEHGFTTVRLPNHKAHTIFLLYSQYCKVSRTSWAKLKASAEKEQYLKECRIKKKSKKL